MSIRTEEMVLNMGPQHPSTHGVLRVELTLDGEVVTDAKSHIGYLHRCFEKHCEALTYPQIVPYVDRMDYLAAMYNEFAYAVAVEKLLGIKVPERVEYIRVILGELQRIASHLVTLGSFGMDIGAYTPFLYCFRDRESILNIFEAVSGARLLYNYIWVGGVARDVPDDFIRLTADFVKTFRKNVKEFNDLLSFNKIFTERTANIGILPQKAAINAGITGPNLRASGVKRDLRKDFPYSIYDRFEFDVPVGEGLMGSVGDSWDRFYVRVLELEQSLNIIEQALESFPEGNVHEAVPKRIKPPVGNVLGRVENPRGELGYYIISKGQLQPFRVKTKAPSFINLALLGELCKGHLVADVVTVIASIDIVLGEVDR